MNIDILSENIVTFIKKPHRKANVLLNNLEKYHPQTTAQCLVSRSL